VIRVLGQGTLRVEAPVRNTGAFYFQICSSASLELDADFAHRLCHTSVDLIGADYRNYDA
jgi:hypothetical protein